MNTMLAIASHKPLPSTAARLRYLWDFAPLVAGLGAFVLFPDDLAFVTQVLVMCLFSLSLSLVLGQAGIASIGHAAMFGVGAYAAGNFALHLSQDPLLGLVAGGLAGAVAALLIGLLILRVSGFTLAMLSIGVAQVILECANKATWATKGDDGFSGFDIAPLLGVLPFDFRGTVGCLYALAALVICYAALQHLARSPFGLTCRGIREDRGRMVSLGCPVFTHLLLTFCIGGLIAGIAGAINAQTAKVVALNSLDFSTSAGALIMVVLGGRSRLSGALVGAVTYMVVQRVASTVDPNNWMFVVGGLLVFTVFFLPNGLIELFDRGVRLLRSKERS